jgi:hypothetical protein
VFLNQKKNKTKKETTTKPTEQHSLYIKLLSKQHLHQRQGFSLFKQKTKDYLF